MSNISVVVTCYKEGDLLRRAFASLEAQTDRDFEIVLVNDASPDPATNAICEELGSLSKVRLIRHTKNGGLSAARNTGYAAMRGEICVPLDADDILPPTAVAAIRKAFQQAPEADFIFGDYLWCELETGSEKIISGRQFCDENGWLSARQLLTNWLLLGTSPCKKTAWARIKGYADAFSYDTQDIDFFMRLLVSGGRGFYTETILYNWYRAKHGMNNSQPVDAHDRLRQANLAFFDAFGDGSEVRQKLIWNALQRNDFQTAQPLARQLLRSKTINMTIVLLATLPPQISAWLYHFKYASQLKRQHDV